MIGAKIKELREARELTQENFAKILGVSRSALGLWEQGRRDVPQEMIVKIADFFNVSTDYLYGRPTHSGSPLSASRSYDIDEIPKDQAKAILKIIKGDPSFNEITAAWPTMSEADRNLILAMVQRVKEDLKK